MSVGYGPMLEITLIRNLRHLSECVVVTSPDDELTQAIACSVPNVRLHITDAFTRHQAKFNKGLALEEGFDVLGRNGWFLIWDSDCVFPDEMPLDNLKPDTLYGCHRRILEDPSKWTPELDWRSCPISRDGGPIGFFQLANASDSVLINNRPWYDVSFGHAGGGDAAFLELWNAAHRVVLPFDVLHLGKTDMNWFGCDQEGQDKMAKFCKENGWRAAACKHSAESAARAGPIVERVEVPGYPVSTYQLPFVKRAQRMRDQKS